MFVTRYQWAKIIKMAFSFFFSWRYEFILGLEEVAVQVRHEWYPIRKH